jgi:acetolactate synthase-1/2/3 large subunit
VGTSLSNPDFIRIAEGFGMQSEAVTDASQIDAAIKRGLAAKGPYFIEVQSSLKVSLPLRGD